MIVLLDDKNYFTESYAKIGSIKNGTFVESLPNDLTNHKTTCWRLEYYTIEETSELPEYETDENGNIIIDEETGNYKVKTDENGDIIYKTIEVIKNRWVFDEDKYTKLLEEINNRPIEKTDKEKIEDLQIENQQLINRVSSLQESNKSLIECVADLTDMMFGEM